MDGPHPRSLLSRPQRHAQRKYLAGHRRVSASTMGDKTLHDDILVDERQCRDNYQCYAWHPRSGGKCVE